MGVMSTTGSLRKNFNIDISLLRDKSKLDSFSKQQLIDIIIEQNDLIVPLSIFDSELAPLEALVTYLVDVHHMPLRTIAQKLNRSSKTIWTTYHNAKQKQFHIAFSEYSIPLSVFSKTTLSALESLVVYLKDFYGLEFYKIAKLISRDNKTVWTCYHRAAIKFKQTRGKKNENR